MSHSRLSRHEIKHDEFVSGVARAARWAEDHTRLVLIGASIIAAGLVLGVAGKAWWEGRQEKALGAFAEVERRFHAPVQGEQDAALRGAAPGMTYPSREAKFQGVLEAADQVLRQYRAGAASRQALYYKGLALRELGRYDDAVAALRALLDRRPAPLPRALARVALAETLEAAGRWDEGAAAYKTLFETTAEPFPREMALLGQARCLEQAHKIAEARALYRQLVETYPGSPYAAEAEERMKQAG